MYHFSISYLSSMKPFLFSFLKTGYQNHLKVIFPQQGVACTTSTALVQVSHKNSSDRMRGKQPPPLETRSGKKKNLFLTHKESILIHKNEDEIGGDLDLPQQLKVSATFLPRIARLLLSFSLFFSLF